MIIKMKEEEKQVMQKKKKKMISAKNCIYCYLPEYRMRVVTNSSSETLGIAS